MPLTPGRVSDTGWKIRGVADMNLDGRADLIWQHQTAGLIATWLMLGTQLHGGTLLSPGQVADTDWIIRGPR
ncbi:MAG: hypothetical protein H0W08_24920 [Acidobacteria bacterium]|nr:hypothetical protein [Acidobacteriota bacterium]